MNNVLVWNRTKLKKIYLLLQLKGIASTTLELKIAETVCELLNPVTWSGVKDKYVVGS